MAMTLLPPPEGLSYTTLDGLIRLIQEHADPEGYAAAKKRTKNNYKTGLPCKSWLRCDRGRRICACIGQKRIHSTSHMAECPFDAIARLVGDEWVLSVRNGSHNHSATLPVAYASLRKMAVTPEIKNIIKERTKNRSAPSDIISTLHFQDDEENPTFKARDIYNAKAALRRTELGPLTPTQALIKWLHTSDSGYYVKFLKNAEDQVTHLFFSKDSCLKILRANWEVIIMNCIYKTNKYKLPLLVITGVTAISSSFYVAFCFLEKEETEDYVWMLQQYHEMCIEHDIPDPIINITDREKALINAHSAVLPDFL